MKKEELKIKAKEFLIKHQNITSAIAKTTIYDGYIDCMIDYSNTETAALRKEVEELRECFKDLHIFCLENGEVVNGFRSKEIIQKSKNLLK